MLIMMQASLSQKRGKKEVGFSGKHLILGIKRHLLIEAHGHPLNFTIGRANYHDQRNLLVTVDGIRIGKRCRRPKRLRSEEHTSELQSRQYLVCRLLLEKKKNQL